VSAGTASPIARRRPEHLRVARIAADLLHRDDESLAQIGESLAQIGATSSGRRKRPFGS